MKTNKYASMFLGAVTGLTLMSSQQAYAELIEGVNKELVCKRPKTNERQLKLHSCATANYPLAPIINPEDVVPPEPTPPYSS